jgi:hypothetical protein
MCMQDIDIARQTKTNTYFTQGTLVIPPNPSRLAIRIVAAIGDFVTLSATLTPTAGASTPINYFVGSSSGHNNGIPLSGSLPDDITLERIGDLLKGPLTLTSGVGTGVYAIETYLDVVSPMPLDVSTLP